MFSLSVVPVVAEDIDDVNETEEILIYSDEDTLVYATVNVEDLENFDVETAYQEFSESYNEESTVKTYGYAPGQPSNPSPDRRLMFTRYMTLSSIKSHANFYGGVNTFTNYFNNPFADAAIANGIKYLAQKIGVSVSAFGISVAGWVFSVGVSNQATWWNDTYKMIIKKQITGLKYECFENLKSDYPKVFNVYTRY